MVLLALWATPRTVSTAFERMMIERADHLVLDEPWSRAYYLGPDRRSPRFPLAMPESSYAAVTAGVLAAADERPVFVKDMAYQVEPGLTDELLDSCVHSVLVRDPRASLVSLLKEWPDATPDEFGFDALDRLVDAVAVRTGAPPVVVDSDALRADPVTVIGAWCDAVGIDQRVDALSWQPGMRPEWPMWQSWYTAAAASTDFAPPSAAPARHDIPFSWRDPLERARAVYERLAPLALG